ncbi:MAG TPA: toxin-antitoxin (TA) system antitoxin [Chloroflexia bacterium]|jgi:antitoxin (DNA-binding transcriptional repressor) of toxin-antitoxin stability system
MTTKTIDVHDEQVQLAELLSLAKDGIEFILIDGATPLARLVPMSLPTTQRIAGLHAHLGPIWMSDDFDEPLPDEFWTEVTRM